MFCQPFHSRQGCNIALPRRLDVLVRLSRQIAAGGLTLDEAEAQLARAQRIPFPNDWVQLAAGLAYGPWMGFLTSFSASAVANMSVYLIARRLVPVIRRLVADTPKAAKLLDSVRSSKDPWFYTILAFITPGLPNGIIPYAAANAGMRPKQFLAAIFISLPFPTLLTCAAGSFMLEGNWLFTVLTGIVLFSFVGILFFNRTKFIAWAHEVKNRHTQKAGA